MFQNKRLQSLLSLTQLALCVIPILALGAVALSVAGNIVEESNRTIAAQNMSNLAQLESRQMLELDDLFSSIAQEPRVYQLINQPVTCAADWQSLNDQLCLKLIESNDIAMRLKYPFECFLVDRNGVVYGTQRALTYDNQDVFREQLSSGPWSRETHLDYLSYQSRGICQKIINSSYRPDRVFLTGNLVQSSQFFGTLYLFVEARYLSAELERGRGHESGSVFILDERGGLVVQARGNRLNFDQLNGATFWRAPETSAQHRIGGEDYLILSEEVTVSEFAKQNWRVYSLTPLSALYADRDFLARMIGLLLVLCLAGTLGYAFVMRRTIFRPLERLTLSMKTVLEGNVEEAVPQKGVGEIRILYRGFDEMRRHLQEYLAALERQQKTERELEIRFLQAQINPHFISNTLNSIRVMADMVQANGVSRALQTLNSLFSHYLRDTRQCVTLREEIHFLEQYLSLCRLRFFNSFSYRLDADDNAKGMLLPKLILQPLVENCIQHGFSDHHFQGQIQVEARLRDGRLEITVADNGRGFPPEALRDQGAPDGQDPRHVGIGNVILRIQNLYGKQYGVRLFNGEQGGAVALLTMPAIQGEEEHAQGTDPR